MMPTPLKSKIAMRALLTVGIGVGITAMSPVSHAEPSGDSNVRYTRERGKVQAKETLETRFKRERAQLERESKKPLDMMSADEWARTRQAVEQAIADQQIAQLERLMKASDLTDSEYPDYLFRLADHYLDKKAYFELQAGDLYEQIYLAEESGNAGEAQRLTRQQQSLQAKAKEASEQAAKVYQYLTSKREFSGYKRLDEAIYYYAFELGRLERETEMQAAYFRLIREHPTSKYIPNAYLSFADYKFSKNDIPEALTLYQKIVDAYKDSPVYAYALYKMGWCYLNPIGTAEPRYRESLNKFVETIRATLAGRAGSESNAKQLRKDSRRDLVNAYVHAGKPSEAWGFFQKVGNGPKAEENMARRMMELLAMAYFGDGMYVESSAIYKTLQRELPKDDDRCEWQARVVVNALATDNKNIQWKETERLGEYWGEYQQGSASKQAKKKCADEARNTIQQMATVWHDEAEKTHRQETYDLAENAYHAYMKYFADGPGAYEMNYFYAELLWAQGENYGRSKRSADRELSTQKFRLAHEAFVRTLEKDPSGKFTQDAAFAQMLAMKNAMEYDETGTSVLACTVNTEGICVYTEKKKKRQRSADDETDVANEYPETPYTEAEEEMLRSYDIYEKYVRDPSNKELPKIMYHRGKMMVMHNKFDEAQPVLEELINRFDGTTYAAWAAQMLVDSLVIKWQDRGADPQSTIEAGEAIEVWAEKLQSKKLWQHEESTKLRQMLPTYLAAIGWKKAEAYREKGEFRRCAETYSDVYNNFANHDRGDTLLFNAARCYEAAYLIGMAIRRRSDLLQLHPDSDHYQQTLKELGQNYQAIAFYSDSADKLEEYASRYPRDEFTPEALQNAYLFRLGLGEESLAQQDLAQYEDLYRKRNPETAAKIYWSKHDLLDTDEAKLKHAREYIARYGNRGGVDRRIVAEAAAGQILWREACPQELLYDSCITVKRKKASSGEETRTKARKLREKKKNELPKYCGTATQGIITVHPRDRKLTNMAQTHFETVMKLGKREVTIPKEDSARAEAYKHAVGMAVIYLADAKYEEYLQLNIPEGLDFTIEDWKKDSGVPRWERQYRDQVKRAEESKQRFGQFYSQKLTLGRDLLRRYIEEVKAAGSPYWLLAGAARAAVVSQNFADQLYRAEVPKSFKTEEQYFAYCDALADEAAEPQALALKAFTYCLSESTKYQFFNEFSRMCEEELQQRSPDKYPATNELFGTSVYTDSRLDVVGVQTDLKMERQGGV